MKKIGTWSNEAIKYEWKLDVYINLSYLLWFWNTCVFSENFKTLIAYAVEYISSIFFFFFFYFLHSKKSFNFRTISTFLLFVSLSISISRSRSPKTFRYLMMLKLVLNANDDQVILSWRIVSFSNLIKQYYQCVCSWMGLVWSDETNENIFNIYIENANA